MVPNGVTSIGFGAFSNCISLSSVTIGTGVTSIGELPFQGCTSLTAINISSGNTAYSTEDGVLFNKDKTTLHTYPAGKTSSSYTILASVTSIGDEAFLFCSGLTGVTIPYDVRLIGNGAFENCTGLVSITIPASVYRIEHAAFVGCTSLVSVTFLGTINSNSFGLDSDPDVFPGNLRDIYLAGGGGPGTYTRSSGGTTWTRQP